MVARNDITGDKIKTKAGVSERIREQLRPYLWKETQRVS